MDNPSSGNIWVADDDRSIRWVLERALEKAGITARCFENADQVIAALRTSEPDVLLTDIRMPGQIIFFRQISKYRIGLFIITFQIVGVSALI